MTSVSFKLNGRACSPSAESSTPLLYVLRDELGLNSPRFGCGNEQCGACMILVDGEPSFSCTLPIDAVAGKTITTVEGLGSVDQPHPLQQAFLDCNAAQCGYCSSGILMSAWHLLQRNPAPSRAEIAAALDAHLCRCGAHNRVIRAVSLAAERMRQSS